MSGSRPRATRLLERPRELERARRAALTPGSLLVVTGPAGIGKTSLLRATVEAVHRRGATVLEASGDELEHGLAYGIVRQLLNDALRDRGAFAPAAELAARALGLGDAPPPVPPPNPDEAAIFHGLNALLAELAARSRVAVLVDDVQWADLVSIRWLRYLARRRSQVGVALLLGLRAADSGDAARIWRGAAGRAETLTLPPLTPQAVAQLLERALAASVDPAFAAACHELTGGNPFYAQELAAVVAERGLKPAAASVERLRGIAPPTVAEALQRRLQRLSPAAAELARACAVLGGEPPLRHAAALARLELEPAGRAADELAAAEVLEPRRPLRFVHPVVRAAVVQGLSPAERADAHARAADLLTSEGAEASRVAVHLAASEPRGDEGVVERLRAAAAAERAPDAAVRWLQRALEEPPPIERLAELLLELGAAQAVTSPADAVPNLQRAMREGRDPRARAEAALLLMRTLVSADRVPDAVALIEHDLGSTFDPGSGADADLRLRYEANRALVQVVAGTAVLDDLRALADGVRGATAAERALLGTLAYCIVFAGGSAAEAVPLAERALAGGRLAAEQVDPFAYPLTIWALEFCDRYEAAERALAPALAFEVDRGSRAGFALIQSMRAIMAMRRGCLPEAEERARAAFAVAEDHSFAWIMPVGAAVLAEAGVARGDLAGAEAALRAGAPDDAPPSTRFAAQLYARAGLRLAQRRPADALDDIERGRQMCAALGHDSPGYYPFRSRAVVALRALGETEQARALAVEELRLARVLGAPRAVGIALRTAGMLATADEGLALLEEAAATLGPSEARLEAGVAFLELGAALRRAGRRRDARDRLREAIDLAAGCGADAVIARASSELAAAGARSLRPRSGAASLTPAEERVASLAAEGLGNAQIASELFLSQRTVEAHLRQVFRKLGIRAREQLGQTL